MKIFSINEIRSWNPCYDPIVHLGENWKGTILDILDHKSIPFQDKLWVIFRTDLVSDKLMRLFSVWSYRQTLKFIKNPDNRSIDAANIAEKYAYGEVSLEELSAASASAWTAAWEASASTRAAARAAAWAAEGSTRAAAWAAARAAEESASAAAWAAASVAEESASVAEESASAAAREARAAAWEAQEKKLKEMIIDGIKTGDIK